jgi:hypothetical protein
MRGFTRWTAGSKLGTAVWAGFRPLNMPKMVKRTRGREEESRIYLDSRDGCVDEFPAGRLHGEENKREGGGEPDLQDLLVGWPDIRSGRSCGRVSGVVWSAGVGGFRPVCMVSDLLFSLFFFPLFSLSCILF